MENKKKVIAEKAKEIEPSSDNLAGSLGSRSKTAADNKPKKSKKGCCFGLAIIFIFLFFSGSGAFGFFDFLPWHGSSYDPSKFVPNFGARDATPVPTATTTEEKAPASPAPASKGSSSTNNNNQSTAASTSTPSTTPADNTTTTAPQPPAESQTPPMPGAQVQTTFSRQEQIDFFVQVAMKNDQNGFAVIPIQKWRTTVGATAKIRYYNDPTGSNLACADATISQINALSNTIHFSKTTGNDYQIRVYFVPKSQIGSGIGGYYNLSTDANHYVTGGNAYVPIDAYDEVDRCHYIRHEMTHVMTGLVFNGLKNHGGYDFSIFNVSAGKSDYLEIDKYAIKIMLNSGIGLGWNESQVRNYLAGATW